MILDTDNLDDINLNKLGGFPDKQNWCLKYRGSRDGFSAQAFHSICDGIAETLTVIKSKNGNIFGGFAEEAWGSQQYATQQYATEKKAFIYSLINKENKPFNALFKASYRQRRKNYGYDGYDYEYKQIENTSIICNSLYGPSFGFDKSSGISDLIIESNSNALNSCRSNFGSSYKHQGYPAGSSQAKSILAGSESFETVEIEVFAKKN